MFAITKKTIVGILRHKLTPLGNHLRFGNHVIAGEPIVHIVTDKHVRETRKSPKTIVKRLFR